MTAHAWGLYAREATDLQEHRRLIRDELHALRLVRRPSDATAYSCRSGSAIFLVVYQVLYKSRLTLNLGHVEEKRGEGAAEDPGKPGGEAKFADSPTALAFSKSRPRSKHYQ